MQEPDESNSYREIIKGNFFFSLWNSFKSSFPEIFCEKAVFKKMQNSPKILFNKVPDLMSEILLKELHYNCLMFGRLLDPSWPPLLLQYPTPSNGFECGEGDLN